MPETPALIEALERAPAIVVPLVRDMPPALLTRRPPSGKWSVHEHACHLAVVHQLFLDRLDTMVSSPAPVITPYDPGKDDPDDRLLRLDLDTMLERYVDDRRSLVTRLRRLAPRSGRTAEHAVQPLPVFIMFRHLLLRFFHAPNRRTIVAAERVISPSIAPGPALSPSRLTR
jgi:hypothetical protein